MSPPTLRPFSGDPRPGVLPGSAMPLLVAVIVAVGVFEALWFGVVTGTGLAAADVPTEAWVDAHRWPGVTTAARLVSDVGAPAVFVAVTLLVLAWCAWQRMWRSVVPGAVGLAVLVGVDEATKSLVARPRPPIGWRAELVHGYSFPSGHAMLSAGVVLLVLWLVCRLDRMPARRATRTVSVALAGLFVVLVGASRLVLAVHFPSDVLAGWSLAVLVVAVLALTERAWTRRNSP